MLLTGLRRGDGTSARARGGKRGRVRGFKPTQKHVWVWGRCMEGRRGMVSHEIVQHGGKREVFAEAHWYKWDMTASLATSSSRSRHRGSGIKLLCMYYNSMYPSSIMVCTLIRIYQHF